MSFTGMQNISIDVRRRTVTADAVGGQTNAYSTPYSGRLSRINTLSAQQQAILSRSGIVATHKFFCDPDMVITPDIDEIVYKGAYYRVISVIPYAGAGEEIHHLTVLTKTPS